MSLQTLPLVFSSGCLQNTTKPEKSVIWHPTNFPLQLPPTPAKPYLSVPLKSLGSVRLLACFFETPFT